MARVLVLGGTSEASALARALADAGIEAVLSYAGRTRAPAAQPLPIRVGGFGGPQGLADWLRAERITHLVDATHPFAAQISCNAVAAARATGVPLIALERPAWQAGPGDRWVAVADTEAAVAALPEAPARVFLAIGRQTLASFAARPDHLYLLRLVDPPEAALPLPRTEVVIARGPFDLSGDTALLRDHRIDLIVAKNAGGAGARAKLDAARALGLPVVMIDRPALPARQVAGSVAEVMRWLGHPAPPASTHRGE
ncbi:cobalt-precorrin-6x reductase [Defluviimonas sp. 20V17]|uniref:Precorrin-6A reductase n=1 Tax=Allgaiera indica TaxID=765699 RepID=A0AAN4URC1_9RHOB|nr:cobalt-precorrin-6A reductase [Allgaiera indica]KDB02411.1 cobalt-precorrin-6x reductase [Defluviimonas sp. 20V17]GHE02111.1 precorrin-6A reductase [Allgaiera indica]SDX05040.1 precorrin-6A/cobalt-precorrin-6A reductase [Allgaiera indica]